MQPRASVVITTHDRDEELAVCLSSLARQTVPLEVIVMDDKPGTDTPQVVESAFPGARYMHVAAGKGPAFQRNRGIEAARCETVFPFDDDVELVDPRTIELSLAEFDDPRVAAIGIPFVNVRISTDIHHSPPDPERLLHAYVGASHAVRRDAFLGAGGYRDHFFYMGEEGDLCIRLLDRGHVIRAASAPPLHHFESPRRSSKRAAICGRKNDILFCWHNVPHPFLLPNLAATMLNGARFAVKSGHAGWHLSGILTGFGEAVSHWNERAPVSRATYRTFRQLKKQRTSRPAEPLAPGSAV